MFDVVREQKRPGLIVFLTAGFPDMGATLELVPALVAAGADAVELGVPFSDPLAEGPVIQESSFRALQNGTSLDDCLNAAAVLRDKIPETPLILMGYYNPVHSYGLVPFTERCRQAGVDGLIAVDLPGFESGPLTAECREQGISVIPLLAPTSTGESIKNACSGASGFIYCISVTGVTGIRDQVSARSFDLLDRVKVHTDLPLAVGFGISNRHHVEEVGKTADAAVVGSALIRVILDSPRDELVDRASRFVAGLAGVSIPSLRSGQAQGAAQPKG